MARRRMFSLDVVDADIFIEMPSTARLLYYDLGMRADDDGFITPQKIIRMTGASVDDLKILITKGFIYSFQDGVVVLLHWQRNNRIDSSKYISSIYYPRLRDIKELYIERLPNGGHQSRLPEPAVRGPQGSVGKYSKDKILPPNKQGKTLDERPFKDIDVNSIDFDEVIKTIPF